MRLYTKKLPTVLSVASLFLVPSLRAEGESNTLPRLAVFSNQERACLLEMQGSLERGIRESEYRDDMRSLAKKLSKTAGGFDVEVKAYFSHNKQDIRVGFSVTPLFKSGQLPKVLVEPAFVVQKIERDGVGFCQMEPSLVLRGFNRVADSWRAAKKTDGRVSLIEGGGLLIYGASIEVVFNPPQMDRVKLAQKRLEELAEKKQRAEKLIQELAFQEQEMRAQALLMAELKKPVVRAIVIEEEPQQSIHELKKAPIAEVIEPEAAAKPEFLPVSEEEIYRRAEKEQRDLTPDELEHLFGKAMPAPKR